MSTVTPAEEPAVTSAPAPRRRFALPVETGVTVVLLLAVFWLGKNFPDFRTGANGAVILSSIAEIGIVAAGMTLVIATGGIDISVGSVVGLTGVVLGLLTVNYGWPLWAGILAALAAGAACGLVNGLLIARFKLPPIIATLAMYSAARAGAYMLSNGESISGLPESLTNFGYGSWPTLRLPNGDTLSVPLTAWVALAALLAAGLLLKKTAFGRGLLAMGGSREAAYLSGLKVRRLEVWAYVLSGLLAGVAAVAVTARQATAVPDAGKFFELRAITAVVVGGTPVVGGLATMLGSALGVLTIGVVQNGVRQYRKDSMWEMLVTALVLLAAVELDRIRRTGLGKKRKG